VVGGFVRPDRKLPHQGSAQRTFLQAVVEALRARDPTGA